MLPCNKTPCHNRVDFFVTAIIAAYTLNCNYIFGVVLKESRGSIHLLPKSVKAV